MERILNPSGIHFPATCAPPLGTFLGVNMGWEGYILMLSFSAANKVGIPAKDSNVISASVRNFVLISACNAFSSCGFLVRWYNVPDKAVALVSEPAMINKLRLLYISPLDIFSSLLF